MLQERMARFGGGLGLAGGAGPALGTISLLGEISGSWNIVDGYITYTQDFTATQPQIGILQILLRGYETTREGSTNRYRVDWDRRIYWLNYDGGGPGIPHLLGALELTADYVPSVGDPFPEFNANATVMAQCTLADPCTINWSPYLLFRDPLTNYSAYPEGAAEADLLFVANATGDSIAVSLDLYDELGEPNGSTTLSAGDELELSTIGYKLSEPGFVYIASYMDFVTLGSQFSIEREHYIPGVDFVDPDLVGLNAGGRRVKFLLDAQTGSGANTVYAFGGPYSQGFNWAGAPDFLFRGNLESLVPDGISQTSAH